MFKLKKIIIISFIITLVIVLVQFTSYWLILSNKETIIKTCMYENNKKCMGQTFTLMLPKLLIHKVKADDTNLQLTFLDWKLRLCPLIALEQSEALMSYGIEQDISFESRFDSETKCPVYAFDCGVKSVEIPYPNFHFYSECIGTDKYLIRDQVSSEKIHKFGDKLKELGLENKKIYLKMDIAGAEAEVMPDILKYSDQITAMNLSIHLDNPAYIINRIQMLDEIQKNFVLIARNTFLCNGIPTYDMHSYFYPNKLTDYTMDLVFINKNIINGHKISWIQHSKLFYILNIKDIFNRSDFKNQYASSNIRYVVTFTEIFKEKIKKIWKNRF